MFVAAGFLLGGCYLALLLVSWVFDGPLLSKNFDAVATVDFVAVIAHVAADASVVCADVTFSVAIASYYNADEAKDYPIFL